MKAVSNSKLSYVLALLLGLVAAWCAATPSRLTALDVTGGETKCKCTGSYPFTACNSAQGHPECTGNFYACDVEASDTEKSCDTTYNVCGGGSRCNDIRSALKCPN
jgi:hypothetical protein